MRSYGLTMGYQEALVICSILTSDSTLPNDAI